MRQGLLKLRESISPEITCLEFKGAAAWLSRRGVRPQQPGGLLPAGRPRLRGKTGRSLRARCHTSATPRRSSSDHSADRGPQHLRGPLRIGGGRLPRGSPGCQHVSGRLMHRPACLCGTAGTRTHSRAALPRGNNSALMNLGPQLPTASGNVRPAWKLCRIRRAAINTSRLIASLLSATRLVRFVQVEGVELARRPK